MIKQVQKQMQTLLQAYLKMQQEILQSDSINNQENNNINLEMMNEILHCANKLNQAINNIPLMQKYNEKQIIDKHHEAVKNYKQVHLQASIWQNEVKKKIYQLYPGNK